MRTVRWAIRSRSAAVCARRLVGADNESPPHPDSSGLSSVAQARAKAEAEDRRFYEVAAHGPNGYFAALDELSRGIGVAEVVMTPAQMTELESLRRAHRERTGSDAAGAPRARPTARSGAAMGTEPVVRMRGRVSSAELRALVEEDAVLPLEVAAEKYGLSVDAVNRLRIYCSSIAHKTDDSAP
jgi:hypothetical protein